MIKLLICDVLDVVVFGNVVRIIYKLLFLVFELDVDMYGCMDYIFKYIWEINLVLFVFCSVILMLFLMLFLVFFFSFRLFIFGKILFYGDYCIKVSV